jgi:hypothetical protein
VVSDGTGRLQPYHVWPDLSPHSAEAADSEASLTALMHEVGLIALAGDGMGALVTSRPADPKARGRDKTPPRREEGAEGYLPNKVPRTDDDKHSGMGAPQGASPPRASKPQQKRAARAGAGGASGAGQAVTGTVGSGGAL